MEDWEFIHSGVCREWVRLFQYDASENVNNDENE